MALGNNRPRNHGKDQQGAILRLALHRRNLTYKIVKGELWIAPSKGNTTLPFASFAYFEHPAKGQWEAHHIVSGRLLAKGISKIDVIGKTINTLPL